MRLCDESAGTIDLLAYTDKENAVPLDWEESDPRYITNATDVKLRAFSTKVRFAEQAACLFLPTRGSRAECYSLLGGATATYSKYAAWQNMQCFPAPQMHNVEALVSYKADDDLL